MIRPASARSSGRSPRGSRQGGSLKLLNLTKRIEDLLSITELRTVFDTFYNTEADAVKSFVGVSRESRAL